MIQSPGSVCVITAYQQCLKVHSVGRWPLENLPRKTRELTYEVSRPWRVAVAPTGYWLAFSPFRTQRIIAGGTPLSMISRSSC